MVVKYIPSILSNTHLLIQRKCPWIDSSMHFSPRLVHNFQEAMDLISVPIVCKCIKTSQIFIQKRNGAILQN